MSPLWKAKFEELKRRMRPTQAIVAIARRLLVAVWLVLSKEETDRNASEEDLAWKMLLLSWSLGEEARKGLTYKQFAKYALMKLGAEKDITRFVRKNVPRRLALRDEVLGRLDGEAVHLKTAGMQITLENGTESRRPAVRPDPRSGDGMHALLGAKKIEVVIPLFPKNLVTSGMVGIP